MNHLTFNQRDQSFVLTTTDVDRAVKTGLTKSTRARGAKGESVFYTASYSKQPEYNPYAVLQYHEDADQKALEKLKPFLTDYQRSWYTDADIDIPAPAGFGYLPYQKAGISYALDKSDVLIGDEPGLGKTIQAIGYANAIEAERVLVICPASIRLNWDREIRNWSTIPYVHPYPVLRSKQGVHPSANYVVISYDLARADGIFEALMKERWDLAVIDEAHYLKSTDAQRTQAVFGAGAASFSRYAEEWIADRCDRVMGLTGTPLPNRPRECYTIAKALCWESIDYMSFDDFCYRFNPMVRNGFTTVEEKGRLPELQARLRTNFMIRRLKKDVLKDLPDKRYEFTYIEENGAIREVLAKERMLDFDMDDLKNPFAEIWGQISTLRREMGEAKVTRVVEHMRYLFEVVELEKIVLFAHHRTVMDALAEKLSKYNPVQVRGGVSPLKKAEAVRSFIEDKKTRLFIGQLDSAGVGIDGLQSVASHVVFAEPAWTPGANEQAVDRCHRIGQHDNVVAQFLITEGSLDERVLGAVLDKTQTVHAALDQRI
jgi:SWI/SNF-related matrix-associated actin-dependent regulator 1 of chromatin subfamily A